MHLLTNAGRFSPAESALEIDACRVGDRVEVAVTDHGPGVPAEGRLQLFRKHGRLDHTSSGPGLGLYVSSAIARAHGGELVLRDTADGARFVLVLPV